MKRILAVLTVSVLFATAGLGAGKGIDIKVVGDRISMRAEAVPLGRLIQLFDAAIGMRSTVPPELANRNVSVWFDDLDLNDAVLKIFEGVSVDFALVPGFGITVTGASQTVTLPAGAPPPVQSTDPFGGNNFPTPFQPAPGIEPGVNEDFQPPIGQPPPGVPQQQTPGNPFGQPVNPFATPANNNANPFGNGNPFGAGPFGQPGGNPFGQQQPATIQTPFGPIANPRANQTNPVVGPGAAFPGQPAINPFSPGDSLFGNTSPQLLGAPGSPAAPGAIGQPVAVTPVRKP